MTICIAALCQAPDYATIIGSADRMMTTGDMQYQPQKTKVWPLMDGVVALTAGDAYVQAEVCRRTNQRGPTSIEESVDYYCEELGAYHRKQFERQILRNYGLTMESFLTEQPNLLPAFAEQILGELNAERKKDEIETIICGRDKKNGAQIYKIDRHGRAHCHSSVGFATIGEGSWHAQSLFMVHQFAINWSFASTLHLVYTAKRRAEIASSVGTQTDLFYIMEDYEDIPDDIFTFLEDSYNQMNEAHRVATAESAVALHHFLESRLKEESDSAPVLQEPEKKELQVLQIKKPQPPANP